MLLGRLRVPALQRAEGEAGLALLQVTSRFVREITFTLPPQHHQVDQRLGFLARDVAESNNGLVEGGVYTMPAYLFDRWLRFEGDGDALVKLLLGLRNKLKGSQY